MTARIEPTDATLGALVTGVRLAALDDAAWRAVEDAFHQHAVLIFPGQHPFPRCGRKLFAPGAKYTGVVIGSYKPGFGLRAGLKRRQAALLRLITPRRRTGLALAFA